MNAAAESIRTSSMPNSQRLEEATARQTVMSIAPCPRQGCGGHLIMGKKGYGCSHYKQGCGFVIWRDAYGAELSSQHIQSLVHQGKTPPLSLKRDNGDTIQAELLLTDRNTGTLAIEPLRS